MADDAVCSGDASSSGENQQAQMDVVGGTSLSVFLVVVIAWHAGDANLGLVMLVLLMLGLMNYSMRDPCTC